MAIEISGDQRPIILGLSIAFPIISTLAVILRFEARRLKEAQLGADDWTILAAQVSKFHELFPGSLWSNTERFTVGADTWGHD